VPPSPLRTLLALAASAALLAPQLLACCAGMGHSCTCADSHGTGHSSPLMGERTSHCDAVADPDLHAPEDPDLPPEPRPPRLARPV
jgi:hypothetical protein